MPAAIELKGVTKNFGMAEIIRGVDLAIPQGERHAIIGPSGAGKSTLFNLVTGKYELTSGEIRLNGETISGLQPFEINRRGLSRSFQITNIFHNMTVFENVRCGLLWSMGYKYSFWTPVNTQKKLRARAEELLEQINLADRRNVVAGVLTYAEQRALEIAITIAGGASVIMLDEPTAGMSRSETSAMVDLIRTVTEGKTLVVVEHDLGVVFDLADKISVLVYGEIIESGLPDAVRASDRVQEAYLGTTHEIEH